MVGFAPDSQYSGPVDAPIETPEDPGIHKFEQNLQDGTVKVTMSEATAAKFQKALPFWENAMTGMQTELERITQRESQARSRHPVIGAIQQVAASLAQQPDMPGFVRGLGQASAAMNPNADDIAKQKLPLYIQLAKMEEDRQKLMMGQQQIDQQGELGRMNAASLRLQRQGQVDAKEGSDMQRRLATAADYIKGRVTEEAPYRALFPKASDAEIKAFVTSAQSEKVRQAALDDSLSGQRLAAADAQRAGAALKQTQNILKKRFADIEGLKLEEEVNLLMARSSATAAEQKEKAARLFLAYDRALDAKGAKKIEQLTALAAFPNIQGTALEKKILDEIELAGGSMPRQSVAWASPINYADPRTVGTPGTVSGMKPGSPEAQAATGAPAAKSSPKKPADPSLADKMFETIMGTDAGKSVGRVLGKTRATVDNVAGARGRRPDARGLPENTRWEVPGGQSYIVKNGQWVEIPK